MNVSKSLLTDDQMRQFISRGYLVLKTDFPKEFHESLNAKLKEVMEKEGNPGNNILPRLSEFNDIVQSPVVHGALTSVVGHDYTIHPHRHCHFTYPGRKVQGWHKDSYWGHQKVRNHHNWWAMIFYYPQAVDEMMGPSGLLGGFTILYETSRRRNRTARLLGRARRHFRSHSLRPVAQRRRQPFAEDAGHGEISVCTHGPA